MPQFIYTMKGLGKVHPPDTRVLDDIWLSFYFGAKIGVLGLNGAGKSSLLKIMSGEDQSFIGEAFPGEGISIGFLHQEPKLNPAKNVLGNVEEGVAPLKAILARYDEVNEMLGQDLSPEQMDKVLEEQGKLQDRIDALNLWDLDSRLELAMDALRLPPPDADVSKLSGGERRRVALCRLLLQSPDLLLLDEPTNHLDAESVAWLEKFLKDYAGTVVAVTHDRYFLDNVAGWILELDRGRGIPWEGNYSSWLEQKQNRLAQEEKAETKRQRTLQRELDWIRMSPRARQAKGKARLNAYEELLREDTAQKIETAEIFIQPGPRLGDVVVEARGLKKGYGDNLLIDGLDFTLPRGGIVGVIGPNGAGKTTLFRMMTGQEKPDGGTLRLGETVQVGYVDQSREALSPDKSVFEEITGGGDEIELGKRKVASRAYVSWFNFKGAGQQRKVGTLSGGERNRVHLAKLLRKGSNLLLLDEPTNDLDVDTLRALEEALLNYAGCAVVISHDRWFLDRIATHMLAFEGDSQVVWFEGNYQDYEADRKRRLGGSDIRLGPGLDRPGNLDSKKGRRDQLDQDQDPERVRQRRPPAPQARERRRQRRRRVDGEVGRVQRVVVAVQHARRLEPRADPGEPGVHDRAEGDRGGDHHARSDEVGPHRSEDRVGSGGAELLDIDPFLGDRRLQVELHVGGDGGADDRDEQEHLRPRYAAEARARQRRGDLRPVRLGEERRCDVGEEDCGEGEEDPLDALVAAIHDECPNDECSDRCRDGDGGTENRERRCCACDVCNGVRKVGEEEHDHREERPAHAKVLTDEIREPLATDDPEACDRLLHQGEEEGGERQDPEEAQPRHGAERCVGGDAACIVSGNAGDQARSDDGEEGDGTAAASESFAQPEERDAGDQREEAPRRAAVELERGDDAAISHASPHASRAPSTLARSSFHPSSRPSCAGAAWRGVRSARPRRGSRRECDGASRGANLRGARPRGRRRR